MQQALDALEKFGRGEISEIPVTLLVHNLRAELAKPEPVGWVSVADQLPPVRMSVFMCRSGGERDLAAYDPDRYSPPWRYASDYSESIRDVTHWMHIPRPPATPSAPHPAPE
jgi:hypothetical protein